MGAMSYSFSWNIWIGYGNCWATPSDLLCMSIWLEKRHMNTALFKCRSHGYFIVHLNVSMDNYLIISPPYPVCFFRREPLLVSVYYRIPESQ